MELYAVKYGRSPFKVKYLFADQADNEADTEIVWLYYLLKDDAGRITLFDTGFSDPKPAAQWGITLYEVEAEVEAAIPGFRQAEFAFITHSHFDHIGDLAKFPRARIILSRQCMELALQENLPGVAARLRQPGVQIIEGEYTLANGCRFKVYGGHFPGSAVVYLPLPGKKAVITGDECLCRENLLERRCIGAALGDPARNREFLNDAQGWQPLPFHDEAVCLTGERISEHVFRIF